jgi:hypothetical protein
MQGRPLLLAVFAVSLVACGDSEDTAGSSSSSSTTEPAVEESEAVEEVEEAAEPQAAANENTRDIHGLLVTVNEDGSIAIQGADRWGGRLDTVYADATYFRNAVPVLQRSVTEEQGAGLEALLESLPEAETPTPAPTMASTMAATMAPTMAPAEATMAAEGDMAP